MRVATALCILCAIEGIALADLASGRDKLLAGDYKGAIAELGKVSGKDRPAARVLLARAQLETGDYAAAEATATALGKDVDAHLLVDDVRIATGRAQDALADLEQLRKDHPDDRAVRTALATVRYHLGDHLNSGTLFEDTIHEYDNGKIDLSDPLWLDQLAEAARYTKQYELANDSYRAALHLDPKLTDAGVRWAELFSQKYASELAAQTLEEVFKVNPNHPDAHAAMAEVILDTTYDLAAVHHHLDAALAVNPKNARALRAAASLAIDQNRWDEATKLLDKVLDTNAQDVEAIAQKATIAWLRDDLTTYHALEKEALSVDPKYAEFYRVVSRSAVREHRYIEAIDLEKQAIALDPTFYEAMAGAGLGYLRLGMEKEALEWLDKAYKGDHFNVRTVNTLNLFERTIPKQYSFATTKDFKIRFHNDEKAVLERYIEPTLERAFADMVKRYGFTPKTPVILELYADRTDYAVRTVGLPDLGALGITFGQVITAMSPATGDINWGMVLWHELGHVFAIQLSNSRVPRWYTEGLSEYETLTARPDWRRENDTDLYGAVANGTLVSIADLNGAFMNPDPNEVIAAYYQSAVTIEYLAQTYGFPKIVDGLKLYGKGLETPDVLKQITGKTIAELDRDFRAYLDIRLAPYKGTFKLPTHGFSDVTKLEIAADAAPKDAKARANVALGYYYAGDAEKSGAAAKAAVALDPKQPIARYILAEIAVHDGDSATAKQLYTGLAADGHDSYDVRARLAQLAKEANDPAEFQKQLCAAKVLDPERSYPFQALAQLYETQGRMPEALREWEQFAFLEQMDLGPLKKLVVEYGKLGNWAKVKTYGEMATYINPADPDILNGLGRAYLELGQPAQALYTFDTMLVTNPPPRRPALVQLGRAKAFAALGKMKDAKAALTLAKQTEPENADVLALEAKLK